jgi:hypothetical protein
MPLPRDAHADESVGAWAKSYYFAVRDMMDSILRPYDLGRTQWYMLYAGDWALIVDGMSKPPPALASGKFGTPCERMQSA